MAHFFSQRKIIIIFVTIGSQQTTHERVVKTEQKFKSEKGGSGGTLFKLLFFSFSLFR